MPEGQVGTPPNCDPEVCSPETTGTPPDCEPILPPILPILPVPPILPTGTPEECPPECEPPAGGEGSED